MFPSQTSLKMWERPSMYTQTLHWSVTITPSAQAFDGLDTMVCYSVKANSNIAVVRTLARLGAGADVVSGGELKRALAAGVPANKIVFSGVGKTTQELGDALKLGIMQINVESEPELEVLKPSCRRPWRTGGSGVSCKSRCGCSNPCKNFNGKGRKQVRH